MMNVKISQKHNSMYYIRKNYTLKSIYDDENECINYMLSCLKSKDHVHNMRNMN